MSLSAIPLARGVKSSEKPCVELPERSSDLAFMCVIIGLVTIFFVPLFVHWKHIPYDFESYHFPLLHFSYDEFLQHRFPFYDPYVYAGGPYLYNTQASQFYLPLWLFFGGCALSGVKELSLSVLVYFEYVHFLLLSVGFFLFLRTLGSDKTKALAGSLTFTFSGVVLGNSQHLGVICMLAWIPFLFIAIEDILKKPSIGNAVRASIPAALIIQVGFLPYAAMILSVMAVYLLARAGSKLFSAPLLLNVGLFGSATLLLSSVTWLPVLHYFDGIKGLWFVGSMPPRAFATLLFPNMFGHLGIGHYDGSHDITKTYMYAGPFFVTAFISFMWTKSNRLVRQIFLLFVTSMLITFEENVVPTVLHALPLLGILLRPSEFYVFVLMFGVTLLSLMPDSKIIRRWCASIIFASLTIMACIGNLFTGAHPSGWSTMLQFLWISPLVFMLLFEFKGKSVSLGTIMLISAFSLFAFDLTARQRIWTYEGRYRCFNTLQRGAGHNSLVSFLKTGGENFRVAVNQRVVDELWDAGWRVWRIRSVNGFEPIIEARYVDIAENKLFKWNFIRRRWGDLNPTSPYLDPLCVRYYVTSRSDELQSPNWRIAFEDFGYRVYENINWQPIVRLKRSCGMIESIEEHPGFWHIKAKTLKPAPISIFEKSYGDWTVTLNGEEVPARSIADGLGMQIDLPEGLSELNLSFSPKTIFSL